MKITCLTIVCFLISFTALAQTEAAETKTVSNKSFIAELGGPGVFIICGYIQPFGAVSVGYNF